MACEFRIDYTNEEETHWIFCDIILSVTDEDTKECAWETIGHGYYYNKLGAFINAWMQANQWLRKLHIAMGEFEDGALEKLHAESYWMGCGE